MRSSSSPLLTEFRSDASVLGLPRAAITALARSHRWGRSLVFPLKWLPAEPEIEKGWPSGISVAVPFITIEGWTREAGFSLHLHRPPGVPLLASGTPNTCAAWVGVARSFREKDWPPPLVALLARRMPENRTREQWRADVSAMALLGAVRANDAGTVDRLLNEGADPLRLVVDGKGPGLCALQASFKAHLSGALNPLEHPEAFMLGRILSRKSVCWKDGETTPLHLAVRDKNEHALMWLCRHAKAQGLPLNPKDERGETVLIQAMRASFRWLDALLMSGENLSACDSMGVSTMALAVLNGRVSEVRAWLEQGVSPGKGCLAAAVHRNQPSLIRMFLQAGQDPHQEVYLPVLSHTVVEPTTAWKLARTPELRASLDAGRLEHQMAPALRSTSRIRL